MNQTEITAEMIAAAEKAYRAEKRCRKTVEQWLAEVPLDEPPTERRSIAYSLHKRARIMKDSADNCFRQLCPTPELRRELLEMIEREQS